MNKNSVNQSFEDFLKPNMKKKMSGSGNNSKFLTKNTIKFEQIKPISRISRGFRKDTIPAHKFSSSMLLRKQQKIRDSTGKINKYITKNESEKDSLVVHRSIEELKSSFVRNPRMRDSGFKEYIDSQGMNIKYSDNSSVSEFEDENFEESLQKKGENKENYKKKSRNIVSSMEQRSLLFNNSFLMNSLHRVVLNPSALSRKSYQRTS